MKTRILVVEDDPAIIVGLADILEDEGFAVERAVDGRQALEIFCERAPDLVLLDVMIPEKSGFDVCREIRKKDRTTPVIMLTAKGEEVDKVVGLELGADDYVVKPFGFRELLARIRAVLRRTGEQATPAPDPCIVVGRLEIDTRTRCVTLDGDPVALTPKEHDLLVYLAGDPGAVFSRKQLIEDVWDQNWWGSTKTLDVHIASLRKKLGPELIETVRGVGFRLAAAADTP
jgi:DNA-binding response OmpR family regulator